MNQVRQHRSRWMHLLVLAAAALLVSLAASSCGLLHDPGYIVYTVGEEGDRDIAVIRPDGMGRQLVIENPGDDYNPVWSFDRKQLAYISNRDGNAEIYVTLELDDPTDASASRRVTNTGVDESDVTWSPDGTMLAYVSPELDGTPHAYWLELANLRPNRLIFNQAGETAPQWSPLGEWVAFGILDEEGTPAGIYLRNPSGVSAVQVSANVDYNPVWSPNGRRLAFVSEHTGNQDIYVIEVRADGTFSQSINLSEHPSNDWAPTWSSDSSRVVFQTDRNGPTDLYAVDANGGQPIPLTSGNLPESTADFGPTGEIVFVSGPPDRQGIFVMNGNGTDQRQLTPGERNAATPDW